MAGKNGKRDAVPVCETLSASCAMVLKLTVQQMEAFKPRTVAERIALTYANRANRGDDAAFNLLTATADSSMIDAEFEDELSAALREFAEALVSDFRDRHPA